MFDRHHHQVEGVTQWHAHDRGDDFHKHNRHNGKTYFNPEFRSDGMKVKCEGHPSVELGIIDDWAFRKD